MTVLAFMPNRERCGVSDYVNHLYSGDGSLGDDIKVRRVAVGFWNCLKAPFSGAHIVHLQHEYSLFGFAGWRGLVLLLYFLGLRLTGAKLVLTVHTIYNWNRTEELFAHRTKSRLLLRLLSAYGHAYHRVILAAASLLVFLSEGSRQAFARVTPAAEAAPTLIIPIGVYDLPPPPESSTTDSGRLPVGPGHYVVTLFGFAYPNKGYHLAIEACRLLREELPHLRLLVVSGEPAEGGRQYLQELRERVAQSQLADRVVFTGYIPAEDPLYAAVLARTDCFVYPYLRESATSGSLATTLSARKVYITSDLDMFRDFVPGLKFRAGDAADLAARLRQAAGMSAPEKTAYRHRLEAYLAENDVQAMRRRHAEAFCKLLKDPTYDTAKRKS